MLQALFWSAKLPKIKPCQDGRPDMLQLVSSNVIADDIGGHSGVFEPRNIVQIPLHRVRRRLRGRQRAVALEGRPAVGKETLVDLGRYKSHAAGS
jgi:hypothetical protein